MLVKRALNVDYCESGVNERQVVFVCDGGDTIGLPLVLVAAASPLLARLVRCSSCPCQDVYISLAGFSVESMHILATILLGKEALGSAAEITPLVELYKLLGINLKPRPVNEIHVIDEVGVQLDNSQKVEEGDCASMEIVEDETTLMLEEDDDSGTTLIITEVRSSPASENERPKSPLGRRQHKCDTCNCSFKRSAHLKQHLKMCGKTFVCEMCGTSVKSLYSLSRHIRIVHEKKKSEICKICKKAFAQPIALKVHMRTHTKVQPYECPHCLRKFNVKSNLNRHLTQFHMPNISSVSTVKLVSQEQLEPTVAPVSTDATEALTSAEALSPAADTLALSPASDALTSREPSPPMEVLAS